MDAAAAVAATFQFRPLKVVRSPEVVPVWGQELIGVEDPSGVTWATGRLTQVMLVVPGAHW